MSAIDDLLGTREAWSFFAAIRALSAEKDDPFGIGRTVHIEDDWLRFRQKPSLRFEVDEVADVETVDTPSGSVVEVSQTFFGPFGPKGALPIHVTDDALREDDDDLARFLDLFTHRMTALLYRAWETTELAASRDRGATNPYHRWLNAFFGLGVDLPGGRDDVPDDFKRYAAGWFSSGRSTSAAIEGVMSLLLGARVEVDEFQPEWLPIPADERTRLGLNACCLGRDVVVGARAYSLHTKIRVRTTALDRETFENLLPDRPLFRVLRDAMRALCGLSLVWELQPVLKGDQAPRLSLDGSRSLGWDSWLTSDARFAPLNDVRLRADAVSSTGTET